VSAATADRKLFLGILKTHQISVDNAKMAEYMSTNGYTFTPTAIKSRMKRLRDMVKNEFVSSRYNHSLSLLTAFDQRR